MSDLAQDFKTMISDLSLALDKHGAKSAVDISSQKFPHLDQQIQKQIINRIRMQIEQLDILEPGLKESEKISRIAKYHKLRPITDEIYERLTHEHLWEVIDFNLNQIYRSPKVFEIGSYTIDQYETYSPWELFDRPMSSLKELMAVTEVLKISPALVDMSYISPYIIEELLSPERAKYQISHSFACPLFDDELGENRAFISVFKYKKIEHEDKDKIILLN